jgi:hypothetical protein
VSIEEGCEEIRHAMEAKLLEVQQEKHVLLRSGSAAPPDLPAPTHPGLVGLFSLSAASLSPSRWAGT